MGQFSAINRFLTWLEQTALAVWRFIKTAAFFVWAKLKQFWLWLKLRLPFIEALARRHLNNPATFFIDIASFILIIYLAFGITGATLVYRVKSNTRFTEALTVLYPLPAVRVDNSFIWSHRFLQRLRFLNTFTKQAPADLATKPPSNQELRSQIMEGLIEDKIIYLEAQKAGVSVSETELNTIYDQQKKQTENFEQKIHQLYGMSPEEFKQVLAERILKEKIKGAVVTRVRVSHILVTTLPAAQEAKKQLNGGTAFAEVAKNFSQDSRTKDTGGDLGYWTKGELAAQIGQSFEDTAFGLDVNKVSDPIETKFGYSLVVVTEKSGSNNQTYSEWYAGAKKNHRITRYIPI